MEKQETLVVIDPLYRGQEGTWVGVFEQVGKQLACVEHVDVAVALFHDHVWLPHLPSSSTESCSTWSLKEPSCGF